MNAGDVTSSRSAVRTSTGTVTSASAPGIHQPRQRGREEHDRLHARVAFDPTGWPAPPGVSSGSDIGRPPATASAV